jgi:hypothetical protein
MWSWFFKSLLRYRYFACTCRPLHEWCWMVLVLVF